MESVKFGEIAPEPMVYGLPEKSSIITARRRVFLPAQQQNLGTAGAGAGGLNANFLIADGGLLDVSSLVLNYNLTLASGSDAVADDGSVFTSVAISIGGQSVETFQSAPRYANAEMKLKGSKTYYSTHGSFAGFELLNPDLTAELPTSASGQLISAWGWVAQNMPSLNARLERGGGAITDGRTGEQRSIPLSLLCGFGKTKKYLPLSLLGDLQIQLTAGQPADVLFTSTSQTANQDYSLSNISIEYDIVVPSQQYMDVMTASAMGEGIVIPYSAVSIQQGSSSIPVSTTLNNAEITIQRATNNLLSASVVQVPQAFTSSLVYPSQSCFSHAGVAGVQFVVGSQSYPNQMAKGDASIFQMSAGHLKDTCVNRMLWGNCTAPQVAPAVFETANALTGGTTKYAYADSFIPSYDFRTTKGDDEELVANGVSLSGASGSTLRVLIQSASPVATTAFVITEALKFVVARAGGVSIVG